MEKERCGRERKGRCGRERKGRCGRERKGRCGREGNGCGSMQVWQGEKGVWDATKEGWVRDYNLLKMKLVVFVCACVSPSYQTDMP